jgi:pimeloyl-ACP methyl ester carboxylesterase
MISNELHLLLDMAGIKGPYVLVGHSFGGFNVRLFANAYPKDTAGLVLVDSSHEQQFERLENVGPGMRLAPRGDFVVLMQPMVSPELPQKLRPMALALMSTYAALDAVRDELAAFRLSAEQVTDHGWLPEVPTVVVTRGERVWPDTIEGDRKEAIWRHMQEDLAHRNGRAVHLIADFSGHYIPLEQPEVVSSAICIAVETARAGNPPRGVPSVWLKQLCHF